MRSEVGVERMNTQTVYAVVVIDARDEMLKRASRAPAICTTYNEAERIILDNVTDISDSGLNNYALIEETVLNSVYPDSKVLKWFIWDSIAEEYRPCEMPKSYSRVVGFSIG